MFLLLPASSKEVRSCCTHVRRTYTLRIYYVGRFIQYIEISNMEAACRVNNWLMSNPSEKLQIVNNAKHWYFCSCVTRAIFKHRRG